MGLEPTTAWTTIEHMFVAPSSKRPGLFIGVCATGRR